MATQTVDGKILLEDGSKVERRISRVRRLDTGNMVGYASFKGDTVRVEKAKGKRIWTLVENDSND